MVFCISTPVVYSMVSRIYVIGTVSFLLTSITVGLAFQETHQFYPTCIRVTKQSGSMLVVFLPIFRYWVVLPYILLSYVVWQSKDCSLED